MDAGRTLAESAVTCATIAVGPPICRDPGQRLGSARLGWQHN